ncbi:transposase [Labrenzia sp. EL_142]|nr:transposase [Labrenzia sp. EL_142]
MYKILFYPPLRRRALPSALGADQSLSIDLRKCLIDVVEGGMSRRAAAELFGVEKATAIRWVERCRRTGRIELRDGASFAAQSA